MANVIKEVLKAIIFDTSELNKIGQKAISLIREDAFVGIMQDGSSGHKYSRQYAKYKANSMRPLTSGKQSNGGKAKTKHIKQRIGNNYGKSLNTETAFVNMNLTGDTFKGLKVTDKTHSTQTGTLIQIGYDPKDAMKVIGNANRGYIINSFSPKNQKELVVYINTDILGKRLERAKNKQ